MKEKIILILVVITFLGLVLIGGWKYNPHTGSLDWYMGQNDALMTKTSALTAENDLGNSGSSKTVDWNNSNIQKITLTAAPCTLTFTGLTNGIGKLTLIIVQDGSGNRTITWPGTINWPAGIAPTLSTGAGEVDIVAFYYDGTYYYGLVNLNFQ